MMSSTPGLCRSRFATRSGDAMSGSGLSSAEPFSMSSYQCLMVRDGSSSSAHSFWVKNEMVRLACESRSRSSTFLPRAASPAPRLAVRVVLPTPPLWLMIETTFTVLLPVATQGETMP